MPIVGIRRSSRLLAAALQAGPATSAAAAAMPAALLPCFRLARRLCSCPRVGATRSWRYSPHVSPTCTVSRRVSAAFRRAAAAYGVAFQCFVEARTHDSLLNLL